MILALLLLPSAHAVACDGSELLCLSLTNADEVAATGGAVVGGDFDGNGFFPYENGGIDWGFGPGQGFAEGRLQVEVTGLVPNGVAEDDGGKVSIFELCSATHGQQDGLGLQKMAPDYHEGDIFRYGLDDDGLADNWDAVIITAADMGCFYEIDAWQPGETHRFDVTWSPDQLTLAIDDWTCSSWGVGDPFDAPDKVFTLANRCTHYTHQQAQARFKNLRVWAWGEVDTGDGGSGDGGSPGDGGTPGDGGGTADGGAGDGGAGDGGSACDPGAPIEILALSPAEGTGLSQTFTTTFRHCQGADQLRVVQLYVGEKVDGVEANVHVGYEAGNFVYEGMGCAPGEDRVLQGSRGAFDCAQATASRGADELLVRWPLSFDQGTFGGPHGLFVDAKGGAGNGSGEPRLGWTRMGTWTVATEGGTDTAAGPGEAGGGCGCGGGLAGGWVLALLPLLACSRRFVPTDSGGDGGTGADAGAGDAGAGDAGSGDAGAGDGAAGDGGSGDGGSGKGGAGWSLLHRDVPIATGSLRTSSVTWDPASGTFLGVWGQVTGTYHVDAAVISVREDGVFVGPALRVDDSPYDAFEAEAAAAPDGRILIAFEDDREGTGTCCREIYGQLLEVDGDTLVDLGPDLNLSQVPTVEQYTPALAWVGDRFLLAWSDERERTPGGDERRLYGRWVDRDGGLGPETKLAGDSLWQVGASLAADGSGTRALLTWGDYDAVGGSLDCGYRARVLAPDGSPLSEVLTLVRFGNLTYDRPAVAWSEDRGAWLVAWTQPYGIRGSWIAADGTLLESGFVLVDREDGAGAPRLAWSAASGSFLLAWHAWWTTQGYAQALGPDGRPVGEPWPLTAAAPPLGTFYNPVAASPDGRALALPSLDWAELRATAWVAD